MLLKKEIAKEAIVFNSIDRPEDYICVSSEDSELCLFGLDLSFIFSQIPLTLKVRLIDQSGVRLLAVL